MTSGVRPLSVLHVNKYFYARAGAETAYFATRSLLADRGHTVVDFAMTTEDDAPSPYADHFAPTRDYLTGSVLKRAKDAAASVYSVSARRALAGLLDDRETPPIEIAHLHNVYHQLTPSVIDELAARQVPMVMTIHDWKLACPAYTLYRDGEPCRLCTTGNTRAAVVHRCVKGSLPASIVGALETRLARWRHSYDQVARFIVPSDFGRRVLLEAGVEDERVTVLPNFLREDQFPERSKPEGRTVLFAGRLDETKGVGDLLDAWRLVQGNGRLMIAGTGPLKELVEDAAASDPSIEYLGFVPHAQVAALIRQASAVVLPARWEENCPMIILETQAIGRPVIVTDRGGLPDLVSDSRDGRVVPVGNVSALASAMTELLADPGLVSEMGDAATERAHALYTPESHYDRLSTIYREVVNV